MTYCALQRLARREIVVRWSRSAINVVGLIVFVYFFGIMGVIYSQIVASAFMSALSWWDARKSRAVAGPPEAPPLTEDPAD